MPNSIIYGQTPGYTFEDWSKINYQDWNDPAYWTGAGQQQWGPMPLNFPQTGITPEFFNQQKQQWDNWLASQPTASAPTATSVNLPVTGGVNTVVDPQITGSAVQASTVPELLQQLPQSQYDYNIPEPEQQVSTSSDVIDIIGAVQDASAAMPEEVTQTGTTETTATSESEQLSKTLAGLADPQAREVLSNLIGQTEQLAPLYGQSLERMLGLPGEIDQWTQDLISGYRTRNEDIIQAMNAVANQRAAQGIMGGTETENLRARTMANLAEQEQQQRQDALLNAMGLKTGAITGATSAAGGVLDQMTNLLGLTDKQVAGEETAKSLTEAIEQADKYQYTENPQGVWNQMINLLNFLGLGF
jgi:hypothetical protein